MANGNLLFYLGRIIADLVREVLGFPVWWYTRGLALLANKIIDFLGDSFKALNLAVWLKNLFVPMYGQRDIVGWLVSFFMRLTQIIFRGVGWLFLMVVCLIIACLWLLLPPLITWQIFYQLT